MDKEKIQQKINELEAQMSGVNFWNDKNKTQAVIKEIAELKEKKEGVKKMILLYTNDFVYIT